MVSADQYRELRFRAHLCRVFFEVGLADRVLVFDWIAGSRHAITLKDKERKAKAKFRGKLTPGTLLTFLPTHSLQNRLFECS